MHGRWVTEESFEVSLARRTVRTTDSLRRLVTDLPFESVEPDEVDAIRFVYTWPSFATAAAPVDRRHGYWGWMRWVDILVPDEPNVLDHDGMLRHLASLPEDDRADAEDALSRSLKGEFASWFRVCWAAVRGARPELRGFISTDASVWLTDLDTGERLRENACGVEAWSRGGVG
jgi:hypothetical protein